MKNLIKIGLIEFHPLLGKVIEEYLNSQKNMNIIAYTKDDKFNYSLIKITQPDIILTGTFKMAQYIKKYLPHIKVILLDFDLTPEYVEALKQSNIDGYALKYDTQCLLQSIHRLVKI